MKNKEKKGIIKEFKEFIARGNVMDMAIGVVLATAFGKITTSLVNNIIMPFVAWIFGTRDMSALDIIVREEIKEGDAIIQEGITIGFGALVSTIIDFILIALVVFMIVKVMNKMKRKKEEAPAAPPAPSKEEVLLTEIRDILKEKN